MPPIQFGLIGHRGVSGLYPENTLVSFAAAKSHGLNWIEFDVMPCASGEWMVIHDERLERTTNGHGFVHDHSLLELKKLDAGSWFSRTFENECIPTLIEVLNLAKAYQLHPNIEIKINTFNDKVLRSLINTIKAVWPKKLPMPLFSSFNLELLILLRQLEPCWPISFVSEAYNTGAIDILNHHKFQHLSFQHDLIRPQDLFELKQAKIPISLYTLNDFSKLQMWQALGVDSFFTDRPDLLQIRFDSKPKLL